MRDKAFDNRSANLLGPLTGDKGAVQLINGFLDLAACRT